MILENRTLSKNRFERLQSFYLKLKSGSVMAMTAIFSVVLLIGASPLEAEKQKPGKSELERLWEKACEFSYELHSISQSKAEAQMSLKYRRSLYPFSFNTSLDSSFSDVYEDLTWVPNSASASVTVGKKNPGGNTVQGGVNYSLSRGIMDFFEPADFSNIGYSQTPAANLSISQSLCPFYFQNEWHDPNVSVLKENAKLSNVNEVLSRKTLLENVTSCYIQYRQYLRLCKKQREMLSYHDERVKAALELERKGQYSSSDVWEIENARWSCFSESIGYETSRDSALLNLKTVAGSDAILELGLNASDSVLPKVSDTTPSDFPSGSAETEKIRIQERLLELENILSKQTSAPKLVLSGTFSENLKQKELADTFNFDFIEDKSNFSWSFSLGVSFDEFFSPSYKLRREKYEGARTLYMEHLFHSEFRGKTKKKIMPSSFVQAKNSFSAQRKC